MEILGTFPNTPELENDPDEQSAVKRAQPSAPKRLSNGVDCHDEGGRICLGLEIGAVDVEVRPDGEGNPARRGLVEAGDEFRLVWIGHWMTGAPPGPVVREGQPLPDRATSSIIDSRSQNILESFWIAPKVNGPSSRDVHKARFCTLRLPQVLHRCNMDICVAGFFQFREMNSQLARCKNRFGGW